MTYETLNLTWRHIPFTLSCNRHYFPTCGMALIEIRCKDALPLTPTGYKSIFRLADSLPEDIIILGDMILTDMDRLATESDWQDQRQMSLF